MDRTDADPDALARAPRLEASDADLPLDAGVSVVAAPPVPWPVAPASLHPQRQSWLRADGPRSPGDDGTCPCWDVFGGAAFAPLAERRARLARLGWPHADPPAGWVVWVTPHRDPTYAFGILDGHTGRVRWVGLHFGPARPIGRHGATTWIAGAAPMDDTGVSLYAVDPAATSIGRLTIHGARIPDLDAVVVDEARGIPAVGEDGETVWLAWDLLERARAKPGTVLPMAR